MNRSSCVIRPRGRSFLFTFLVSAMMFLMGTLCILLMTSSGKTDGVQGTVLIKSKGSGCETGKGSSPLL